VSYITTDGQSASLFWYKTPICGLRPDSKLNSYLQQICMDRIENTVSNSTSLIVGVFTDPLPSNSSWYYFSGNVFTESLPSNACPFSYSNGITSLIIYFCGLSKDKKTKVSDLNTSKL
jgi:hypothetical protein